MALFAEIIVLGLASAGFWLVWQLIVRPFAVAFGLIPRTAYDYVIRAWKAERQGQWAEALAEYNHALELNPRHPDAISRRDALLAAHPELVPGLADQ